MREVDGGADVWIYEVSGGTQPRQLTFGNGNRFPIWSADGDRIAFQTTRDGDAAIFWQLADGSGPVERLTTPPEGIVHTPDSFSSDGATMSYSAATGSAATGPDQSEIWMLDLANNEETVFASEPGVLFQQSVFAPDARWVAYQSTQTGEDEIVVQPYPPTGARYQLPNTQDNHHPMWSPDGSELFYVPGSGQFRVVEVSTGSSLEFGNAESISAVEFVPGGPNVVRNTDMMPDGERFVSRSILQSSPGAVGRYSQIRFVLNWFEELKERVPVD
jgi:Tol biopolymer transport system component